MYLGFQFDSAANMEWLARSAVLAAVACRKDRRVKCIRLLFSENVTCSSGANLLVERRG